MPGDSSINDRRMHPKGDGECPDGLKPSPLDMCTELTIRAKSSRRLGLALTRACPLKCSHCSASAGPYEELISPGMSRRAKQIISQMPQIAASRVEAIDFTGGEPTLPLSLLADISASAASFGIECTIITSGYWATSPERAMRTLSRLKHIRSWDISTDVYHIQYVDLAQVRLAFETILAVGHEVRIRIAYHDPMTAGDAELIDNVFRFAGRKIGFQPIGPVGRAKGIPLLHLEHCATPAKDPCPTTGLLITPDGRLAPCCGPLSHSSTFGPFDFAGSPEDSIAQLLDRWRCHPLLQTIRIWGFGSVISDLERSGTPTSHLWRKRTCDQCLALIQDRDVSSALNSYGLRLRERVLVASGLQKYFGETWMADSLQQMAKETLSYL